MPESSQSGSRLRVWRLVAERWVDSAFSGEGARLYPGRWNHRGTPMVYTAGHRAMAALELLVHLDPATMPDDLLLIPVDVPSESVSTLPDQELPPEWQSLPAPESTRNLGTAWARRGESLGLSVPSVVLPRERNLLLNPSHPELGRLEIGEPEPFCFDPRLVS